MRLEKKIAFFKLIQLDPTLWKQWPTRSFSAKKKKRYQLKIIISILVNFFFAYT